MELSGHTNSDACRAMNMCIKGLMDHAEELPSDVKTSARAHIEELLKSKYIKTIPYNFIRAYIRLHPSSIPKEIAEKLQSSVHLYPFFDRAALADDYEAVPETIPVNFFPDFAKAIDIPSVIQKSATEVYAMRDILEHGDVFVLTKASINPIDLRQLLAITEERNHEIMILCTKDRIYYFVGNDRSVGGGKNARELHEALGPHVKLHLHTHPLHEDEGVRFWQSHNDVHCSTIQRGSRRFIGGFENRSWQFQEFGRLKRETIGQRVNLEVMSYIISSAMHEQPPETVVFNIHSSPPLRAGE